jgi:hydroxymethylpyrimidine pyrophosphatase-like HAD family hydrolase
MRANLGSFGKPGFAALPEVGLFAFDFDGTLKARSRPVAPRTLAALRKVQKSGISILLVTGRCLAELSELVDQRLFDGVVAENGAVIIWRGKKSVLSPPGWRPVRRSVLARFRGGNEEVIVSLDRSLLSRVRKFVGGRADVILNKDRLMVVPSGIDKGAGFRAARAMWGGRGAAVCFGDGENDLPMFREADFAVALANAVPSLKREADYVSPFADGKGTVQAIGIMMGWTSRLGRPGASAGRRVLRIRE